MLADDEAAARHGIVRVCRRLYERGLIAGPDGNVSVRLGPERVLVTPAGLSKGELGVEDLVEVTLDGRAVPGRHRPSTEVAMHLRIYARRSDIRAVVHAHPPTATAFGVAGETVPCTVLPELVYQMGAVALVPYAMPGTEALADAFEPYVAGHDAFVMANHGAVTAGRNLVEAHQRMESLEHAARIVMAARLLGRVNELSAADVAALVAARTHGQERGA
ncbi:MAG: class II aldolase/adducin family protein [Gemmatimonadota bacterium]|nr:class II aldolase/adducin family protein [Gemmatimonadota bacterium]